MRMRLVLLVVALLPSELPAQNREDTLADVRRLSPRSLSSAYFTLETPQTVLVTAVGGEPRGRSALRRFLDNGFFQAKEDRMLDPNVWPGNAWILDARTREVIWELRTARTTVAEDDLREFAATLQLPAGTYQVNYAALFPVSRHWKDERDWRFRPASHNQPRDERLHGPYLDDGSYRRFHVTVTGSGRPVPADSGSLALVTVRGTKPKMRSQAGFQLDRAMPVEIYLVGEEDGGWADYGFIMDATTRRVVWTAKHGSGEHAGGARKNRVVRRTVELGAGQYVAVYRTDDSHDPAGWNETPPLDASSWGLTLRVVNESDRGAARRFEYQPVPSEEVFVALTGLDDDELRWQNFTIRRPVDVRIFALGEATGQTLHDYGWIVDGGGRVVWKMTYGETSEAGGSDKNRVFAGTVRLPAGKYVAYFVTDGSHSFRGGWNADEPMDGELWGITIAPARPKLDIGAVIRVDDVARTDDRLLLARLTQVGSHRNEQAVFSLPARSAIRVYALGEGRGEMSDYASIEDATGQEVWRMTFPDTEGAGGSDKNRRVDRTMTLGPGRYTVHFSTDGSHAWKDWNSAPPDDPLAWGVTIYRAPGAKP